MVYRQRIALGGWEEEVYQSYYEIGKLCQNMGMGRCYVISAYLDAYNARNTRAEPLFRLAVYLRNEKQWNSALIFAHCGIRVAVKKPDDFLFIEDNIYEWRMMEEYGVALSWVADYEGAFDNFRGGTKV